MSVWRKTSKVLYARLLVAFIGLVVMTAVMDYQSGVAQKKIADAQAQLDAIEASSDVAQVKVKKAIELELSGSVIEAALVAKNPTNTLRDRILAYTRLRYQQTDPLPFQDFFYQSDVDCVRKGNTVLKGTRQEVLAAWYETMDQFESWTPYVSNPDVLRDSCRKKFDKLMLSAEKRDEENSHTFAETLRKGAAQVSNAWDSATKPVTDIVNQFNVGYQSGKTQ